MKAQDPGKKINRLGRQSPGAMTKGLSPNGTSIVVNLRAWQVRSGRRPPSAVPEDQIVSRWHLSCARYHPELPSAGSRRTGPGRR
jgi:hypothetical protein